MKMTAVLTGVTGKSGQYTIERLAERKDELNECHFCAIVRSKEKAAFIEKSGLNIELCVGSIDDDALLLS